MTRGGQSHSHTIASNMLFVNILKYLYFLDLNILTNTLSLSSKLGTIVLSMP